MATLNKKGKNRTGGQKKYDKRPKGDDCKGGDSAHNRQKKGGNGSKKW